VELPERNEGGSYLASIVAGLGCFIFSTGIPFETLGGLFAASILLLLIIRRLLMR
jgi:hypothetical protein